MYARILRLIGDSIGPRPSTSSSDLASKYLNGFSEMLNASTVVVASGGLRSSDGCASGRSASAAASASV